MREIGTNGLDKSLFTAYKTILGSVFNLFASGIFGDWPQKNYTQFAEAWMSREYTKGLEIPNADLQVCAQVAENWGYRIQPMISLVHSVGVSR